MGRQNIKFWGLLALATSPIIVTFSGVHLVQAQSTAELLISVKFPSGPQRPSSEETRGAGTRGDPCTRGEIKLTALMPGDNVVTTVANNPKFFLYVPEHKAKSAEFEITDKSSGKSIYLTELDISETSGIVKLTLPKI